MNSYRVIASVCATPYVRARRRSIRLTEFDFEHRRAVFTVRAHSLYGAKVLIYENVLGIIPGTMIDAEREGAIG